MRAAVGREYGAPEVVRIEEVEDPVAGPGQVVVRVRAAEVTSGDARVRGARFPRGFALVARLAFGVRRPRNPIRGLAFSGEVEVVGAGVTGLAVGDRVAGLGGGTGTHAELVAIDAARVVAVPTQVTHEEAAGALFGGVTALVFLRDKAHLAAGARVLVNGASGAVGLAAVQIARHFGAEVTGVCSAGNAELVRSLGAAAVVDYAVTPLESLAASYDVIVDTVGSLPARAWRRLLTPEGVVCLVVAGFGDTLRARGRIKAGVATPTAETCATVLELVRTGELCVVLDEVLPLDRIVQAHARVDSGHKVGAVVVVP